MKKYLKKYKHLSSLLVVSCAALFLLTLPAAIFVIGCWQLAQIAMSKRTACRFYESVGFSDAQVKEIEEVVKEIGKLIPGLKKLQETEGGMEAIKGLPGLMKAEQKRFDELHAEVKKIIKSRMQERSISRRKGQLSEKAAAELGGTFVLMLARSNKLEQCLPEAALRTALMAETKGLFGIDVEKTLGTADIPLPVQYFSEIKDLIAEYGVIRNKMMPWPLSGGTDKPPRLKTRFGLTSVAMAAQLASKGVQIEFASLESHKVGGIIYTPRELREQSIVALGQYIAKLSAIAAAQVEDEYGFLADGTAGYESIKGVVQIATENDAKIVLAAAKTSTSDVVVADFRKIFGKVNSRVRTTGEWYMNNTWEAYLPELNTQANQYTFRYDNAGRALLFGRLINWTEVLAPYSEDANPSAPIAVFGALDYWWFGTRTGGLRIDESSDFAFDYDLIATRIIEEFDFDYMAKDAAAVVKTGAGA
jgi:HK97 family phage major capsid protein